MSWRTLVISKKSKLDYKLNYMEVRGDELMKVHLSELNILIIANTAVSLTTYLLCELIKNKVKVIFCDEKRNPSSELISYYGSHDTSAKVRRQISWSQHSKGNVWTEIVKEKIKNQRDILYRNNLDEHGLLNKYMNEVIYLDETNREGHAAKVYFNALFGMGFSRREENSINSSLNFGYSLLLSVFNREIYANGYITQLGISHNNMFNNFNLASDLMEPFRTLIDAKVYELMPEEFGKNEKIELLSLLQEEILIDGRKQVLDNAIKIYSKSIFDAIEKEDISLIKFYKNEL